MTARGLHHIGYWVDDLQVAVGQAERLLGIGPFRIAEHIDMGHFRFRGEPAVLDHSAAFAQWGPVLLELNQAHRIEPHALRAALDVRAGAVSHTSWWVDDLDHERAHMELNGCALLTTAAGGATADWFDGGPLFGHPIEIHQPTQMVREMWDSLRAD
ncbi:VOC family protein [uncultured Microbacterium sp.]|uniref:VOC family protein n=1 Tax=uncultured Microbacterium sp. TaxID=191216 RepID=UPI0028D320D4|nr:VOC family protein [uncultured Microbacterium sp.]